MRTSIAVMLLVAATGLGQVRPIREVRQNNDQGEPLLLDQTVTVTGVVTEATHFGGWGPAYVQDSTGGVALYGSQCQSLSIGDSVTVTGTVKLFNGLTELDPIASLTNHGASGAPAPTSRTLSWIDRVDTAAGYVENEGRLAEFPRTWIDHTAGESFAGDQNYTIRDGSGQTSQLRIDRDAGELVGMTIPDDSVDLVGIVAQYKQSAPYFGGYQVMPRTAADLGVEVEYTPIAEAIADENGDRIPDRLGDAVTVTGIATVPSGLFDDEYLDIYVQDAGAGVNVFSFSIQTVALGDSVAVSGEVDQYRGKTEISGAVVTVLASGRQLPEPRALTCNDVNAEAYEGELVRLVDITSDAGTLEGNRSYDVQDATGATSMYVEPGTDIPGHTLTAEPFTLTGIKGQYADDTVSVDDGYQIIPRFRADFAGPSETLRVLTIAEVQRPGADGVTPALLDSAVLIRGRLTGPASAFTVGTNASLYIEDETQGINVYGCNCSASEGLLLDSVGLGWEVFGTVTEYNGLTEIANGSMRLIDSVPVPVEPRAVPFNVGLAEGMESDLVTVVGDVIEPPVLSGGGYNITIKNGTPAIALRVNQETGINVAWITRGRRIRVTGIVGQYDYEEPYSTGYQLMPRFESDVRDTSGAFPPAGRMTIDSIVPSPFSPQLGQAASVHVNSPAGYRLTVTVFDLEGREVRELLGEAPGGYYDLKWDGTDYLSRPVAAGIYLVNLKGAAGGGRVETVAKPVVVAVKLD